MSIDERALRRRIFSGALHRMPIGHDVDLLDLGWLDPALFQDGQNDLNGTNDQVPDR